MEGDAGERGWLGKILEVFFQPQWFCEMTCGVLHAGAGAPVLVAQGGSGAGFGILLGNGGAWPLGGMQGLWFVCSEPNIEHFLADGREKKPWLCF